MMRTEYAHRCIDVNALGCLTENNNGCFNSAMELKDRLIMARVHAGLTQIELAQRSGVPQQTISKAECGKAKTTAFVVQLAVACGVRPEWLAMESGEMLDGIYVNDEKLKRMLMIAQELPEYAKDRAIKELSDLAEFVEEAAKEARK